MVVIGRMSKSYDHRRVSSEPPSSLPSLDPVASSDLSSSSRMA